MDNVEKGLPQTKADIQKAGHDWKASKNSLHQESLQLLKQRCGYVPAGNEPSLETREKQAKPHLLPSGNVSVKQQALPSSIDWRNSKGKNFLDPVRNQGHCESCVAFGTTAAVESRARIALQIPSNSPQGATLPALSPAQLFFCVAEQSGFNCKTGWNITDALRITMIEGLVPDSLFPYPPVDQPCKSKPSWSAQATKSKSSGSCTQPTAMKAELVNNGPLISSISIYPEFKSYSEGVFVPLGTNKPIGGHCIAVVGYDDEKSYLAHGKAQKGAWLCKNSWGTSWGEAGYFWVGYGLCGIDHTMWYPKGFAHIYQLALES